MNISDIPPQALKNFREGCVIPAHPLSLTPDLSLDREDMSLLTNYYISSGVGGIAVGVHTTQFEIRDPEFNLFEEVLKISSLNIDKLSRDKQRQVLKISGVCGPTDQAIQEAHLAADLGYHASLLSLAAVSHLSETEMIEHCKTIANIIPIIGFYLQPAVGGAKLSHSFWKKFATIDNVLGIKMAPFNRYQTIDVVRAVCEADREDAITLYTGNDDNIINDLLTPYTFQTPTGPKKVTIKGGLLGHWCVWTQKAVCLLEAIKEARKNASSIAPQWLEKNIHVTDANGVLFDVQNDFAGCIPGVHEVLRRQGLMKSIRCLNPNEKLSPGQSEDIDRIYRMYPELNDDAFVSQHIDTWKSQAKL